MLRTNTSSKPACHVQSRSPLDVIIATDCLDCSFRTTARFSPLATMRSSELDVTRFAIFHDFFVQDNDFRIPCGNCSITGAHPHVYLFPRLARGTQACT
mmetsp:Transcript_11095/g.20777  ORF Transcript_11095/g.20777 Transcript_11095/m.20777 type:complete len:99 (+) Transcript_11095:504-800(+)